MEVGPLLGVAPLDHLVIWHGRGKQFARAAAGIERVPEPRNAAWPGALVNGYALIAHRWAGQQLCCQRHTSMGAHITAASSAAHCPFARGAVCGHAPDMRRSFIVALALPHV